MDNLVFHFQMDGCALYKESEEAQQQVKLEEDKRIEVERLRKEATQEVRIFKFDSFISRNSTISNR